MSIFCTKVLSGRRADHYRRDSDRPDGDYRADNAVTGYRPDSHYRADHYRADSDRPDNR